MPRTATTRRAGGEDSLTVPEVIAELKITRSTFYGWKASGKAPRCYRLPNGALRVRRIDFEQWFASLEEAA